MLKLHKSTSASRFAQLMATLLLLLPCYQAVSNEQRPAVPMPPITDDSALIVEHIKQALPNGGLISVEQHTGRLLFNPTVAKLHTMDLKQKFMMPAMIINQSNGLKLIGELPFSCFIISGKELVNDAYKGFRQYETIRYIRDVKSFPVSKAMICQAIGTAANVWKQHLGLRIDQDPFVFEEHVSLSGEHFYYFVNADGSFEMYM